MEEILRGEGLTIAFQPIVRVTNDLATTFAYEALTRVCGKWLMGGPVALFEYAQRRGKLAELNIVAMECALEQAASLPAESAVFINIDPLTFSSSLLAPSLYKAAARAGIALDRVVLEITERSALANHATIEVFDELRGAGVRFALDDHGSAYSHLSQIRSIRPSFIKVSNTFGTAFELDEAKELIVRHTVALARDFGCETILEGIESSDTARAAVDAGIRLVQGFHFSHARAAAHWASANASPWAA
jgi:EAL domain-containing protein (putative c-di-GMP-specific phosphodiesterase class I)